MRNRDDGSVEAVFEGDAVAVETLVAWCRQGPPLALVARVEVDEQQPLGERVFGVR